MPLPKHLLLLLYSLHWFMWLALVTGTPFDSQVRPACPPEAEECHFELTVTEQGTMVWYDRSKHKGFPVLSVNGTFYRRLPDNCDELEPLTGEGNKVNWQKLHITPQ